MSHIVTIQAEIRDEAAIKAACKRLGIPAPIHGTAKMFDGTNATGWQVNLPDWCYPVVCQQDGTLAYDNFGGRWGDESHLNRFRQAYQAEKAKLAARKRYGANCRITEKQNADGSIRMEILA